VGMAQEGLPDERQGIRIEAGLVRPCPLVPWLTVRCSGDDGDLEEIPWPHEKPQRATWPVHLLQGNGPAGLSKRLIS